MNIVERICEKTGKSKEEVWELVEKKRKELDYLISEEGALHIVASELGVNVGKEFKVNELKDGTRGVEIVLKVLRVFDLREWEKDGRKGKVRNLLAGDETGRVFVSLWDEKAETKLSEGDIIRISGGYVKQGQNLEIRVGRKAAIEVNPKNVDVKIYVQPLEEKKLKDIKEGESVKVRGALVRVFEGNLFYESPEGRQLRISGILDDGTDRVRVVFFRKAAERLLGVNRESAIEVAEIAGEDALFRKVPVGRDILIIGRVKRNENYDNLEIIANWVGEIDPGEEVDRRLERIMGL